MHTCSVGQPEFIICTSIACKGSTIGRLEGMEDVVIFTADVSQHNAVGSHNVAHNKKGALWDAVSGNMDLDRIEQEQLYNF